MFTTLDWSVLITYFLLTIALGAFFTRKNTGLSQCLFAGGSLPWWAVGISLIATSISATTFLGNPAEAYSKNMTYMMLNLGIPVSIFFTCVVFIPYIRNANVLSAYELLEIRFDLKTRFLAAIIYSIHLLLRTGVLLLGPAIVFSKILNMNVYYAIFIIGSIAVLYTIMGGIRAVVWTDVLQFIVLSGGAVVTLVYCASGVEGGLLEIMHIAGQEGKFKWFDASFDLASPRNFWSAAMAYIILDLAIRACDQQFVQRYLSCSNIFKAQKSTILSAILGAFVGWVFFMVGAFLFSFYTVNTGQLYSGLGINEIFPFFIINVLPTGLSGLLVAAIFAASMSSLDSAISALSNTTTVDFFIRAKGLKNDRQDLKIVRLFMLLWGMAGIGVALLSASATSSLLHIALSFTSLFTGPLLGIFILARFVKSANGTGTFIGALTGMVVLALVNGTLIRLLVFTGVEEGFFYDGLVGINRYFVAFLGEMGLVNKECAHSSDCYLSWPWYPVISCSVTVIAGWVISRLKISK